MNNNKTARRPKPGTIDMSVLDQGSVWFDVEANEHYLDEMGPIYRQHVLNFLWKHTQHGLRDYYEAWQLHQISRDGPTPGTQADWAFDGELEWMLRADDEEWFEELPLVQALRASLPMIRVRRA